MEPMPTDAETLLDLATDKDLSLLGLRVMLGLFAVGSDGQPVRQSDLALRLGMPASRISEAVTALRSTGWLTVIEEVRDGGGRPINHLTLGPKARPTST